MTVAAAPGRCCEESATEDSYKKIKKRPSERGTTPLGSVIERNSFGCCCRTRNLHNRRHDNAFRNSTKLFRNKFDYQIAKVLPRALRALGDMGCSWQLRMRSVACI